MDYVIHYDLASIALCLVVAVLFHTKSYFPSASNRAFRLIGVALLGSSCFDIISVYTLNNINTVPIGLNYFVNILYFWMCNCAYIAYYYYMIILTCAENGKAMKIHKGFCLFVLFFNSMMFFLTPWTKFVFSIENGVYTHGRFFFLFYFISFLILFICVVLTLYSRRKLTMLQKLTTYFFVIMLLIALGFQILHPEILVVNFVSSVFWLLIYQSLQNPAEYLDQTLGVFNQKAFLEMTDILIKKKKQFTVLAFELEGFQFVDQFMGVENGNQLLENVAKDCLVNLSGKMYHLEGTQFAFIFERNAPEVVSHAEWIRWRFLSAFQVCAVEVSLIARICAVNYPDIVLSKEQLMNAIAFSIQEAKRDNTTEVVWATKESISERRRDTMITHILNRAVRNREFDVYYQPILSTKHREFCASEALVRLKDEELGFISPEEFVPLAEKSGLILEIGDIVFSKVCEFIETGEAANLGIKYIEVNLSMVQCMQENLHKHLLEIMDRYKIPYNMIDFEITETFSSEDNGILVKNMEALIDSGCTFAMDDYGTGFSNTDYLMEFPFKLIKLDKSFVWAAMENDKALKILQHTVAMIKSLDLKIVAEGVETKEQAEILIEMGCDYLQGYYFSPPIPTQKYIDFMKEAESIIELRLPEHEMEAVNE